MDAGLLVGALVVLYVTPTVIVLVRHPTMPLLIITLDLVCGWTIAGWAAALLFSIAFPRSRDVRARALAAAEPSASALPSGQAGDPESRSFIRDPLTVGVLTFIGSGAYYFWWCWQFFKLAKRERFPRARSFWWIFVPLYGLAVMFRIFEDLELRLSPKTRGSFDPRAAIAMVIAGNMCAAFSARLAEPAGIGLFFVGGAFFGAAIYMVQGAANGYLYATYPGRISKATSWGEVTAMLIGVALLGLSVAGATLALTRQHAVARTAVQSYSWTPLPSPTPIPTPIPTAGPFPLSGNGFQMTSEPGDFIGQGVGRTFDSSDATFTDISRNMAFQGVGVAIATGQPQGWFVTFAPPPGETLHVGTYLDARQAGFNYTAPGLDVHGDGRNCANVTGMFSITRLVIDSQGQLQSLDVTFFERCNTTLEGPSFRGRLRFDRS